MPKLFHSQEYNRFCELLIKARKEAGITQEELASRLGHPQSYVSKYEQGERRIDLIEFLYISKALNIQTIQFIKEVEKMIEDNDAD